MSRSVYCLHVISSALTIFNDINHQTVVRLSGYIMRMFLFLCSSITSRYFWSNLCNTFEQIYGTLWTTKKLWSSILSGRETLIDFFVYWMSIEVKFWVLKLSSGVLWTPGNHYRLTINHSITKQLTIQYFALYVMIDAEKKMWSTHIDVNSLTCLTRTNDSLGATPARTSLDTFTDMV